MPKTSIQIIQTQPYEPKKLWWSEDEVVKLITYFESKHIEGELSLIDFETIKHEVKNNILSGSTK